MSKQQDMQLPCSISLPKYNYLSNQLLHCWHVFSPCALQPNPTPLLSSQREQPTKRTELKHFLKLDARGKLFIQASFPKYRNGSGRSGCWDCLQALSSGARRGEYSLGDVVINVSRWVQRGAKKKKKKRGSLLGDGEGTAKRAATCFGFRR